MWESRGIFSTWWRASMTNLLAGVQLQQPGIQPEKMDGVGERNEAASQFSFGLPIYFKFKILFYIFTKSLGQRFDIFSSPSPRFIISINHCCSSEFLLQWFSQISLIIYYLPPLMCPIVNLWLHCNSCYIPQFTTYLPKSYLPLTSWAHYLLKRLLAIVSLKIPNFYKL